MDVLTFGDEKYYCIEQILSVLDQCVKTRETERLRENIYNSCDLKEVYHLLKKYGYEIKQENCNNCIFAENFRNNENLIYCTITTRVNYKCRWCQLYRGVNYEGRRKN